MCKYVTHHFSLSISISLPPLFLQHLSGSSNSHCFYIFVQKGYCKSKEGIFFPSQLNKDADTIAETVDDDTCDGTNDLDANADYLEMTDNGLKSPDPEPAAAPTKTSKWRSAIDAATGRTYYYLKGTKMTSWVKPSGM